MDKYIRSSTIFNPRKLWLSQCQATSFEPLLHDLLNRDWSIHPFYWHSAFVESTSPIMVQSYKIPPAIIIQLLLLYYLFVSHNKKFHTLKSKRLESKLAVVANFGALRHEKGRLVSTGISCLTLQCMWGRRSVSIARPTVKRSRGKDSVRPTPITWRSAARGAVGFARKSEVSCSYSDPIISFCRWVKKLNSVCLRPCL